MSVRACRFAVLPLLVWAAFSVGGCALERAPLSGGGGAGMDAGAGVDADVAMTDTGTDPVDAFAEPVDAARVDSGPTPCSVACTDGRVCESGTCVCPAGACCPGCTDGRSCVGGSCMCPAGECCPACPDGRECVGGTCMMPPCGGLDQPCCASDSCTAPGTVCSGGGPVGPPRGCRACGELTQPCCAGDMCNGSAVCDRVLGVCRNCGGYSQPCCPTGDECPGSPRCMSGYCF